MKTNRKQSLCVTIDSYHDGGAEAYAIRLANALSDRYRVVFIELLPERTHKKGMKNLLNAAISSYQLFSFDRWIFRNRFYRVTFPIVKYIQLRWLFRKHDIRTVLSHSHYSDSCLTKWAPANTSIVSFFHGHYEMEMEKPDVIFSQIPSIIRRLNAVIYTSRNHLRTLSELGFPASRQLKLFYGYNGTRASQLTKYQPGSPLRLGVISRAIEGKGWETTIRLFSDLSREYPGRLELHMVGDGPDYERFKNLESESIRFYGFQVNPRPVLDTLHVGILLSTYTAESQPNTVIEYLFAGKPVLATNMGSIEDMITIDGKTAGNVIPVTDQGIDEVAFLQAVRSYLSEPGLIEQQSALALECTRHFDMAAITGTLMNYIEKNLNPEIKEALTEPSGH
ncbi:MAG: glycosyltransferase family 4 protein [Bacteroidetes bacterium]|nr:glycosyltransferase family 4 protein [Bacteroidota bacterium]